MQLFFRIISILLVFSGMPALYSQQFTQTIRGRVISDTEEPLPGAQVFVSNLPAVIGTFSDSSGHFVLENIPVGRRTLEAKLLGYGEFMRDNIQINSAREYYIDIILPTGIQMDAVELNAYVGSDPINELSVVSARRLDPEELQYHAATANDPARLAQGLPGVQNGLDIRNDVVIRGNSPIGLLWRLEGVDIPNPNHYAGPGSGGGGITAFSASMLSSSDFSTGAFPAEYGDAISGVFDMRFRKGNMQQRQHTFRAGLLGLDFATEGPIVKGKSSYLTNFRYSTLGILNQMGIYLISPRNDNNFYDLSFKMQHQGVKNQFSIWGLGGMSTQYLRPLDAEWKTFRDYFIYDYGTQMGVVGASWKRVIDDKSYFQVNAALMGQNAFTYDDTLSPALDTGRVKTERYVTVRNTLSMYYKRTVNVRLQIKTGVLASLIHYDMLDEKWNDTLFFLRRVIDVKGNTWQAQPYFQASIRVNTRMIVNAGVHALYFGLNGTGMIEPRLGAKVVLSPTSTISLGYGLHSKTVPFGNYFIDINGQMPNKDLSLMKSHHLILAFDQRMGKSFRLRLETYYQYLYDLPVTTDPDRKIFVLNRLWGFDSDNLYSVGNGANYGIDLSLEKSFSQGSFFVLSGSTLRSYFKRPGDETKYPSNYDARFSGNFTGGQIFPLGENTFLETGIRFIFNSGYPITPILASRIDNDGYDAPVNWSRPNQEQLPPYFRPDVRVALRRNRAKFAWWLALDVQNFLNRKNSFAWYQFDRDLNRWTVGRQSPLTPVLTFWLDL